MEKARRDAPTIPVCEVLGGYSGQFDGDVRRQNSDRSLDRRLAFLAGRVRESLALGPSCLSKSISS